MGDRDTIALLQRELARYKNLFAEATARSIGVAPLITDSGASCAPQHVIEIYASSHGSPPQHDTGQHVSRGSIWLRVDGQWHKPNRRAPHLLLKDMLEIVGAAPMDQGEEA